MKPWSALTTVLLLGLLIAGPHADARADDKPSSRTGKDAKPFTGIRKRVAVATIQTKYASAISSDGRVSLPANFGSGLTEMLTTELMKSDRFIVVERALLDDVLKEQTLGSAGLVEASLAPKVGKITGAQMLVSASVTDVAFKKGGGGLSVGGVTLGGSKGKTTLALDIRFIDTTTSEVLKSVRVEGVDGGGAAFNFSNKDVAFDTKEFTNSSLGKAARKAIDNAVKAITDQMEVVSWEGRIADVDLENDKVKALYINGGSRIGLKTGDILEIVQPGEDIIDPDTNQKIGRKKDRIVGRAKVDNVTDKMAIAVPIEGEGFGKQQIVRLPEPMR